MNRSEEFLFVYGTLRRSIGHPRREVLDRHGKFVGKARFRGRLYLVRDFPGAVPSDDEEDRVAGELYRLRDPATVLKQLDRYEGYNPNNRKGSLFVRSMHPVELSNNGTGRAVEAWIYLYNRPVRQLQQIPSGDFLKYRSSDQS
ncbi:MAG: gamma-glutamylcyclotransferase family protein [Balneolaceae bacterium]|nr:gamma-glutamylcyclotransferase family protein [Balneolaceae bacterium]